MKKKTKKRANVPSSKLASLGRAVVGHDEKLRQLHELALDLFNQSCARIEEAGARLSARSAAIDARIGALMKRVNEGCDSRYIELKNWLERLGSDSQTLSGMIKNLGVKLSEIDTKIRSESPDGIIEKVVDAKVGELLSLFLSKAVGLIRQSSLAVAASTQ